MDWLNLHASTVDGPEFIGASSAQRGTWMSLILLSISEDMGGSIAGCREWTDAQWMDCAGIRGNELEVPCDLFWWSGIDLMLHKGALINAHSAALSHKEKRRAGIDPAKSRRAQRMRRAREIGTHTAEQWADLLALTGWACLCCGARDRITKDHIIPVCDGGSDAIDNLQPLCQPCNSSKGATVADYRRN